MKQLDFTLGIQHLYITKNIKHCPILSNFISALPVGERTVGVTNPPLAQFDISFLLQEYNRLPNSKFFFTFLTFLDKTVNYDPVLNFVF